MERNLELIRKLLLRVEESPKKWAGNVAIDGYSEEQIDYHAHLLLQAGLVEGVEAETSARYNTNIRNLTWHGHEFLDAARDEGRWREAMRALGENVKGVGLNVLQQLLVNLTKNQLGL